MFSTIYKNTPYVQERDDKRGEGGVPKGLEGGVDKN